MQIASIARERSGSLPEQERRPDTLPEQGQPASRARKGSGQLQSARTDQRRIFDKDMYTHTNGSEWGEVRFMDRSWVYWETSGGLVEAILKSF